MTNGQKQHHLSLGGRRGGGLRSLGDVIAGLVQRNNPAVLIPRNHRIPCGAVLLLASANALTHMLG